MAKLKPGISRLQGCAKPYLLEIELVAGRAGGGPTEEAAGTCATAATAAVCPLEPMYRPFSRIVSVGVRLGRGAMYMPEWRADEGVRREGMALLCDSVMEVRPATGVVWHGEGRATARLCVQQHVVEGKRNLKHCSQET